VKFGAILVDPPWRFLTRSQKGRGRSPDGPLGHYQTMSLAELHEIPVAEVAADDCALFVWAIDPMLPHAIRLGESWGFTYKTIAFYWAKTNRDGTKFPIGTGYWTRANCEQCLLFTRGSPKRLSRSVPRLIVAPRREHSRKPEQARERIERLVAGPYLDLYGRQSRENWTVVGDQATKFDRP
jgi:N6-adenosine-specific RNA methylase IME4